MENDFTRLYAQLDLPPDCGLDELKHAYRRRVAELHPDRRQVGDSADNARQLAQLITLYKQALRFHARHGRLPGATTEAITDAPYSAEPAQTPSPAVATPPASGEATARARSGWLMVALCVLAGGLLWTAWENHSTASSDEPDDVDVVYAPPKSGPDHLVMGMDMEAVLQVQGAPTRQGSTVWEYGPSWVRFEGDRLVEWYSSPLYRLKTRETRVGSD
ncbi:J domain-containing protein [Pseudoxanthomonas putridarboris]|uniref:J domain-containing protein n=1 Tax=Pseudoxanthomonas putridarboris TaxID=752605 RepID=A0ABU9J0R0_9GAMM